MPAAHPPLTPNVRELAIRNAVSSGQLEGLNPSPQLQAGLQRYAAGTVSVDELLAQARLRHDTR